MTKKSENVSEKTHKRGRPTLFPDWEKSIAKSCSPDITTDRGLANTCYRQRAVCLLLGDPRFYWLGMDKAAITAGTTKMRMTILQELGRIPDEEILRKVAGEICRLKPTSRQAIAMIRAYRGVQRDGTALELANILIGSLNAYLDTHRTMAWDQVKDAIHTLQGQVEQKDE